MSSILDDEKKQKFFILSLCSDDAMEGMSRGSCLSSEMQILLIIHDDDRDD